MFKRGAGLAITLALAVAAARYSAPAPSATQAVTSSAPEATLTPADQHQPTYRGGCSAYLSGPATHGYPYDDNEGQAGELITKFLSPANDDLPTPIRLNYAIALMPDPVHTNLSLMFDRQIVMIQQAAQDEGYTYNSSWLPWQKGEGATRSSLADAQRDADLTDGRNACPGVLLFRKAAPKSIEGVANSEAPFVNGLVVFVVGEQPTGGINHDQWQNAVTWLAKNATPASAPQNILRVLGPTFSGSLDSLERNLASQYAASSPSALQRRFPTAQVFSGSITSCAQIIKLQRDLSAPIWKGQPVRFGTFQENDDLQIFRFLSYMKRQGSEPSDTAILSEDETAYAQLPSNPHEDEGKFAPGASAQSDVCNFDYAWDDRPVHMVYPRDISALRDAYEKQSVFTSQTSEANEHATRTILRDETDEKAGGATATDSVTQYSDQVAALSQEAYLFGVVSYLRAHHNRFLILRCTNPLDFLFLTRFFHREYPAARVVTVGSDLLFRREIDTTEFRGVLSLSSYPLLPRDQHWSLIEDDHWGWSLHNHLIFENGLMEGIYLASRYLLNSRPAIDKENPTAVALNRRATPDYADPFWLHTPQDDFATLPKIPPTWLSTVGRDGYWPLAVLNDETTSTFAIVNKSNKGQHPPPSTMVELIAVPGQHYPLQSKPEKEDEHLCCPSAFSSNLLISLPTPWNVVAVLAAILLCYQAFGLLKGPMFVSDGALLVFRRIEGGAQALLLGGSCALALTLLFELFGVVLLTRKLNVIDQSEVQSNFVLDILLLTSFFAVILWSLWITQNLQNSTRKDRWQQIGLFLASLTLLFGLYVYAFRPLLNGEASGIPSLYREVHLSDGASPLLPVLLLTFGYYLWNWQAMAGNLLLAKGMPQLPRLDGFRPLFYRVSEAFGTDLIWRAKPLSLPFRIIIGPIVLLVVFFGSRFVTHRPFVDLPLLSMEGSSFNLVFNALLLLGLLLTCGEALRLYWTWIDLRRMLLALGRMRLRRTFAHLRALDTHSLWSVSGNVQRTQYRIFIQQLNAAQRLLAITEDAPPIFFEAVCYGNAFREYLNPRPAQGVPWEEAMVAPYFVARRYVRDIFTETTDFALTQILRPAWEKETNSLDLRKSLLDADGDGDGGEPTSDLLLSESEEVQAVEEFVCLHYIGFIQNMVARMRTMTLSMVTLFVSVCFAISSYPFVPRTSISLWMGFNLLLIGIAVAIVYAGMERDEILSYITGTRPGRLGTEFWVKLATFLAAPTIGLLTTQFPTIADSFLSWLQPGLDALK